MLFLVAIPYQSKVKVPRHHLRLKNIECINIICSLCLRYLLKGLYIMKASMHSYKLPFYYATIV